MVATGPVDRQQTARPGAPTQAEPARAKAAKSKGSKPRTKGPATPKDHATRKATPKAADAAPKPRTATHPQQSLAPKAPPAQSAPRVSGLARLSLEERTRLQQQGRKIETIQRLINRSGVTTPIAVTGQPNGETARASAMIRQQLGVRGRLRDADTVNAIADAATRAGAFRHVALSPPRASFSDLQERYAYDLLAAASGDDPRLVANLTQRAKPYLAGPAEPKFPYGIDAAGVKAVAQLLARHGLYFDAPHLAELRRLDGGGSRPQYDEARAVLSAAYELDIAPDRFYSKRYDKGFAAAAKDSGLPAIVLRAITAQETRFADVAPAPGDAPQGPTQIKPSTAKSVGVSLEKDGPKAPFVAQARYLKELLTDKATASMAALSKAIAAYNIGPNGWDTRPRNPNNGLPDVSITQHYVRRAHVFAAAYAEKLMPRAMRAHAGADQSLDLYLVRTEPEYVAP